MLHLKVKGFTVYADGPSEDVSRLYRYLHIKVANWFFATRARPGWDGANDFMAANRSFSYGLLPHVKRWLVNQDIEYKVEQLEEPLPAITDKNFLKGVMLREEQLWALSQWCKAGGRGIIVGPPGVGKTEIAAAAIKHLKGRRALFVVNSLDLLMQAKDRLRKRLGVKVGSLSGGERDLDNCDVLVATIQSLCSTLKSANKDLMT